MHLRKQGGFYVDERASVFDPIYRPDIGAVIAPTETRTAAARAATTGRRRLTPRWLEVAPLGFGSEGYDNVALSWAPAPRSRHEARDFRTTTEGFRPPF